MQKHPKLSLIEHFKDLPDPRVERTKDHDLIDILVIAICTLLCAGESFNDMEDFGRAKEDWFKTFLTLRSGIPSHDTFNRLFAALDPQAFLDCFLRWTQSLRAAVKQEIVALDGKALRRALNGDQSVKYVVSAWAEDNGLVLGQLKVADKSNEITALPKLLRVLELSGCIVTVDAMGTQKKIAREIIEADADYVLALKGNHETVHAEVKSFLDETPGREECPAPAAFGSGGQPGAAGNGGERSRAHRDAPLLSERGVGLVCRPAQVGRTQVSGDGGSHSGDRRAPDRGTAVLSEQPAGGGGNLCARRARALGRGEQTALGVGRANARRPKPGAGRLRRREPGHAPAAGPEPVETGENQEARHQRQATQRQLGSRLPLTPARCPNLDASALQRTLFRISVQPLLCLDTVFP